MRDMEKIMDESISLTRLMCDAFNEMDDLRKRGLDGTRRYRDLREMTTDYAEKSKELIKEIKEYEIVEKKHRERDRRIEKNKGKNPF